MIGWLRRRLRRRTVSAQNPVLSDFRVRCQSYKHEGQRSWRCSNDKGHRGDHYSTSGRRHWIEP